MKTVVITILIILGIIGLVYVLLTSLSLLNSALIIVGGLAVVCNFLLKIYKATIYGLLKYRQTKGL